MQWLKKVMLHNLNSSYQMKWIKMALKNIRNTKKQEVVERGIKLAKEPSETTLIR